MHAWKSIYDIFILFLITIWIYSAGGGLSDKKWMLMNWMMNKHNHHESKGLSLSVKPIAIPLPLPLPLPMITKMKGDKKPEKPWPQSSNDMFWKMMMMKMMMKGKDKKASSMMCCPQQMMQMNGMMKSKAKKAAPMMCCPEMMNMMMMNGGWSNGMMNGMNGCSMMNGGWPPPSMMNGGWPPPSMMCCKGMMNGMNGGGWPEEEEPDYYEEEEQMGWDTNNAPNYLPPKSVSNKISKGDKEQPNVKRGDDIEDTNKSRLKYRTKNVFRKRLRMPNFENDFDYY